MHASIRERRSEEGFTLIELLVVMIIIAILMAVAVPTFLAQKNSAQKTKATANIKQIVNAIESCAANNTDGTYAGCVNFTGLAGTPPAAGTLKAFEKGLVSLSAGPAAVGVYNVTASQGGAAGTGAQGYIVQTAIKDGNTTVYFAEIHFEDGNLYKRCGSAPMNPALTGNAPAKTTIGGTVANSRTCTTGDWG